MSQPVRSALDFLDRIFPQPREFDIRLWEGTVSRGASASVTTLVIRSPGSLRRMFKVPVELSMGEAYLRRDFDIEGDLPAAFALMHRAREVLISPRQLKGVTSSWRALPKGGETEGRVPLYPSARLAGSVESTERAQAAIRYHYDVGNDFYKLFLDERMLYSCAYFPTGSESLDAAQEAKLDLICRKLRLQSGERLLDVGCGWGGLLIHAAEHYGIEGVGITLSEAQCTLAKERVANSALEDRIHIELNDYRTLESEPFDKIVSVGMFEHVGRASMRTYFARLHRLLKPGGLFLNHSIASRPGTYRGATARAASRLLDSYLVGNREFWTRYVFPDGELIPLSEANLAAEQAGFEIRDVENLREHYARTLRLWATRLRMRREEATAIAGEAMFRLWEMYLSGSAYHFESARITINQTLFAHSSVGSHHQLPTTRNDIYTVR